MNQAEMSWHRVVIASAVVASLLALVMLGPPAAAMPTADVPPDPATVDGPVDGPDDGPVDEDAEFDEWLMEPWVWNPPSGYPAFRMRCQFSHLAYADPILAPGNGEFPHLHMFFGNTAADQHSTYQSLRRSGDGTCDGGPLNRTAYWMPAVFDGQDTVMAPSSFEVYYKAENARDPSSVQPYPDGLRMIAGAPHPDGAGAVWAWRCGEGYNPDPAQIPECGPEERLTVWVRFPYCWDGRNLDSPDRRSHMAYGVRSTWGECPSSHPVHLPEISEFAHFDSPLGSAQWYVSSDRTDPDDPAPNGSTFHADWFGAWDHETQDRWLQHCLHATLSVFDGNLCDGQQLRAAPRYDGPTHLDGWMPTP